MHHTNIDTAIERHFVTAFRRKWISIFRHSVLSYVLSSPSFQNAYRFLDCVNSLGLIGVLVNATIWIVIKTHWIIVKRTTLLFLATFNFRTRCHPVIPRWPLPMSTLAELQRQILMSNWKTWLSSSASDKPHTGNLKFVEGLCGFSSNYSSNLSHAINHLY